MRTFIIRTEDNSIFTQIIVSAVSSNINTFSVFQQKGLDLLEAAVGLKIPQTAIDLKTLVDLVEEHPQTLILQDGETGEIYAGKSLLIMTKRLNSVIQATAQSTVVTVVGTEGGGLASFTLIVPVTGVACESFILTKPNRDTIAIKTTSDGISCQGYTGTLFNSATYKIYLNNITIAETAINRAALIKSALEAEGDFTDITITDNLDGTLKFDMDKPGSCSDIIVLDSMEQIGGSYSAVTNSSGTDANTKQGDYLAFFSSLTGDTQIYNWVMWMSIDGSYIEPNTDIYNNYYESAKVNLTSGLTNIETAALIKTAFENSNLIDAFSMVDNLDGTLTITHLKSGASQAAIAEDINGNSQTAFSLVTTSGAGELISISLKHIGGVLPLTWTIINGALPNDISLDQNTGILSGYPIDNKGDYSFTVQIEDGVNDIDDQDLTLIIA